MSATLYVEVLQRSAAEAMAQGKDLADAQQFYLTAASAAQTARDKLGEDGEVQPPPELGSHSIARLFWHAAVLSNWQADFAAAWGFIRDGEFVLVNPNYFSLFKVVDRSVSNVEVTVVLLLIVIGGVMCVYVCYCTCLCDCRRGSCGGEGKIGAGSRSRSDDASAE
mgnify:CR=1 FL=1